MCILYVLRFSTALTNVRIKCDIFIVFAFRQCFINYCYLNDTNIKTNNCDDVNRHEFLLCTCLYTDKKSIVAIISQSLATGNRKLFSKRSLIVHIPIYTKIAELDHHTRYITILSKVVVDVFHHREQRKMQGSSDTLQKM